MAEIKPKSFVENINLVANATTASTGDIVEDANRAKDDAQESAEEALAAARDAEISKEKSHEWATKAFNNPVDNGEFSAHHWSIISKNNAPENLILDSATSANYTWSSSRITTELEYKAPMTHLHSEYEQAFLKNSAFNKSFDDNGLSTAVSRADHSHGAFEPAIGDKNTAFNKNFGTASGTVAEGDHLHESLYMPLTVDQTKQNTAYNKNFVADPNNPLADEVARGNHGHDAAKVSYDGTGNAYAVSSTVQGAISQLDAGLSVVSVSDKTKLVAGMTDSSFTVPITAINVPTLVTAGMTIGTSSQNADYSNGIRVDYDQDPAKLIEGQYDVTVAVTTEGNTDYSIAVTLNGVVINEVFSAHVGSNDKDTTGTFPLLLSGWISDVSNLDIIGLAVYNHTNTNSVVLRSMTVSFAGQPEGALVASHLIVDHGDITGTGAANGVHTISDIDQLDTALLAKADKIIPSASGNVAMLDAAGNLLDSGKQASDISEGVMHLISPATPNAIIIQTTAGDAKDSDMLISDLALKVGSGLQQFMVAPASVNNHAVNFNQLLSVSDVADAAIPAVTTPTAGNFPTLDTNGDLVNSIYSPSSFAVSSHDHAYANISKDGDGAQLLQDDLDSKYDEVSGAATDNIPLFADGNQLQDSGVALSALVTPSDYATPTVGGTLKARVVGDTLYLAFDGTDA